MINDGFTLELIECGFEKNAGLVDMAKSVGGYLKDTAVDFANTAKSIVTEPGKNIKDNINMMWNPRVSDDAGAIASTLNNKWVSRALNLGFPAMDAYKLVTNPDARGDSEVWGGFLGGQLGNYMIPTEAGLPATLAASMGMSLGGRYIGHKVKEYMHPEIAEKEKKEEDKAYIQQRMADDPAFRAQMRMIALDTLDELPTITRKMSMNSQPTM